MVEKQSNGNGKQRGHEPDLNEASARHTYEGAFHFRPVMAGEADVLNVPLRVRLRWGWATMVRESAKLVGVKQETRLRYVPVAAIIFSFVASIATAFMAYGLFKGRTDANEEMAKESRAAIERQISALEARAAKEREESRAVLMGAAGEIKESMQDMRATLSGEVATIRSMVGATQADMARADAKIDALARENSRLRDDLDIEEMRRQALENKLRANGVKID